jgi:hypothetical protein
MADSRFKTGEVNSPLRQTHAACHLATREVLPYSEGVDSETRAGCPSAPARPFPPPPYIPFAAFLDADSLSQLYRRVKRRKAAEFLEREALLPPPRYPVPAHERNTKTSFQASIIPKGLSTVGTSRKCRSQARRASRSPRCGVLRRTTACTELAWRFWGRTTCTRVPPVWTEGSNHGPC